MLEFLRKLCIWICVPIYGLIPKIYSIFYNLANTRFLQSDLIEQFSANIYVLVSVIMLFGFSITILSAIVNPDLLSDNKKGVTAMFKRSIIGLVLMVLIPFAFDQMYTIQESVMTNSLIEKIIVGADFSCPEDDSECEVGGQGGQVIAGTLLHSVLHPASDQVQVSEDVGNTYSSMIQSDVSKISTFADNINILREDGETTEEDGSFAFHFDGLIAIIVGAGVCYILVLFALDMAVRIFKLAFFELTAPISIVGYIAAGDKIISSWFKEVGKTFLDVFIRIAAIAFYLFLINNLSSFMVDFEGKTWRYVLIAFLIIGMLIFAKQVPDMIGKIFGIDVKSQGGIAGRLGNMAVVGKQAQKAWQGIKNAAGLAAGVGVLGAAGAAMGLPAALGLAGGAFGGKKLWDKKLKDTKFGSKVQNVGNKLGNFGRGVGAVGKTMGAFAGGKGTIDALKSANKSWNETGFGTDMKYKKTKQADAKFNKKIGLDEYGRVQDGELDSAVENVNKNIQKDVGKTNADVINKLHKDSMAKSTMEAISGKSKDIVDKLESMKLSARTTDGKQLLTKLQEDFQSGDISVSQLRSGLKELYSKGEVQGSSIKKVSSDLDAIEGIISKSDNAEINGLLESDDTLKMNSVSGMTKKFTDNYEKSKKNYDDAYKGQSESVKADMDRYVSAYAAIDKATIDADKKSINNTTDGQNFMGQFTNNQTNTQNSSSSQGSNVEHTTLQENIDRMANVHDAPTREEHINRQSEYNDLFNSDAGSRYLDANEAEADRRSSSSSQNNTSTASAAAAGAAAGSVLGSSTVQVDGLDDLFNNLNKTITNAQDSTNDILKNQLDEQKNMNSELKNQTNSINNVGGKIDKLKDDIGYNLNDIKKTFNDSNNDSDE